MSNKSNTLELNAYQAYFFNEFFSDPKMRNTLNNLRQVQEGVCHNSIFIDGVSVDPPVMEDLEYLINCLEEMWLCRVKETTGTPLIPDERPYKFHYEIQESTNLMVAT